MEDCRVNVEVTVVGGLDSRGRRRQLLLDSGCAFPGVQPERGIVDKRRDFWIVTRVIGFFRLCILFRLPAKRAATARRVRIVVAAFPARVTPESDRSAGNPVRPDIPMTAPARAR